MTTEALVLRRANRCIILVLLAVAVATRVTCIGDPAIQMDEQYYLLIADRMWHGALLTYFRDASNCSKCARICCHRDKRIELFT
jgi:hypothetical protein